MVPAEQFQDPFLDDRGETTTNTRLGSHDNFSEGVKNHEEEQSDCKFRFQCSYCSIMFDKKRDLKKHEQKEHEQEINNVEEQTIEPLEQQNNEHDYTNKTVPLRKKFKC